MRVVWSPAALREVERIYAYVADFNAAAAAGLVDALMAAGDSLAHFEH